MDKPKKRKSMKRRRNGRLIASDKNYMSYDKASTFVKALKIKTAKEFQDWASGKITLAKTRSENFPSNPHQVYAGRGWEGFGKFLGTGRQANMRRKFLPFEEARAFAQSLQLASFQEWRDFSSGKIMGIERPANIPSNPQLTYKGKGWVSMPDWLGNGRTSYTIESRFWKFEIAREYARSLKLKNFNEWRAYVGGKLPEHGYRPFCLPSLPNTTYKEHGWVNYADWLGSEDQSPFHQTFLRYEEAMDLVWKLRVKSIKEYHDHLDRDPVLAKLLPRSPDKAYRGEGYKGFREYVGI